MSAPGRAFASSIAARSVHWPPEVAQRPSPGLASTASVVEFTVKLAAYDWPGARLYLANREALLHRIQELTVERVMFAPIYALRGLIGIGPRVAEHTIKSIPLHPGPALEDTRLKAP